MRSECCTLVAIWFFIHEYFGSFSFIVLTEEARKNKAQQDQKAIAEQKAQASPSDDEAKRAEEKRARIAQELLDEEEAQKQKAELRKRGGAQQSPAPVAAASAASPVAVTPSKVAASGKLNVVDPVVTPGSGKKKSK